MDEDASSQNAPEEKQSNRLEPVDCVRHQKKKRKASLTDHMVSATAQVVYYDISFSVTSPEESNTKGISGQGNRKKTRTADDVTINVTFCKATSLEITCLFV